MATKSTETVSEKTTSILQLDFATCVTECKNILFSETTGAYSIFNTTGWGTPNPELSTVYSAELSITTPTSDTFIFDLLATTEFPTINSSVEYSIPYSSLGFSTGLVDGEYTFVYNVMVDTTESEREPIYATYTKTKKFYITCNLDCCINKLLLNIEDVKCDCSKEARSKYLEAFAMLQAFKHANACGRLGTATELFNELTKICNNVDCKTCQ